MIRSLLAKLILNKAMVVVVPGKEFGMEGHLRLSFAGTIKDITTAIERMKWVLDPTSPNEIYIGESKMRERLDVIFFFYRMRHE